MMVIPWRAVALALLFVGTGNAFGQPVSRSKPADPLPWGTNQTYADLVRLVVPKIAAGDEAASDGGIRHIGGEGVGGPRPASIESPRIASIKVRSGGMDRLALLLDFGTARDSAEGFTVLALFEMTDKPRLLDAVNVAFDRYTFFLDPARLPVGTNDDLLATVSTHANSGQSYATAALILVRNDRFELVDDISALDDRACAFERTQRIGIRRGAGKPFSDVVATVSELTAASGEDCGQGTVPKPQTRTITVTYRWDAAAQRYIADSDAFDVLAKENEKRF